MYCFHDKIRIYFISFIVQISPFVHLFTLKIVFRWTALPWTCWGPTGPQTPRCKLCLHFFLYLHVATPLILAVCIQRKCQVYSINVSEEKIKMRIVNGRRTKDDGRRAPSDDKSSHCLINFIFFCLTRPQFVPTIYRTRGEHA